MTELTQDKLTVIEAAMLSMYPDLWHRRWPAKHFLELWGPLVDKLTAVQVAKATVDLVHHRKENYPPLPAEFMELARQYAPAEPPGPEPFEGTKPLSPANQALMADLKRSLGMRP